MSIDQFLQQIYPEPNTGCWLWGGRSDNKGYGRLSHMGRFQLAHRFSYFINKGHFDITKNVLHICDNPPCVNPDHLYLGDQKQNNIDRDTRGRQRTKRGSEHKLSKFSPEQVVEIRNIYSRESMPSRKLARIYRCSQKAIMNILNRKSYKNVL